MKRGQLDVDVGYNSGRVIALRGISGKCGLVRVIGYSYQFFTL